LATHVAILTNGRLAASGSVDELRNLHPQEDSLEGIYKRVARAGEVLEALAA